MGTRPIAVAALLALAAATPGCSDGRAGAEATGGDVASRLEACGREAVPVARRTAAAALLPSGARLTKDVPAGKAAYAVALVTDRPREVVSAVMHAAAADGYATAWFEDERFESDAVLSRADMVARVRAQFQRGCPGLTEVVVSLAPPTEGGA